MPRFSKLILLLLFVIIASVTCPIHAFPMPTYDLSTLCFRSTDVVEATLVRHHQPGQEEWKDEFTVIVLNSLEGSSYKAGDQIAHLDLTVFNPALTDQRCILFLNHEIKPGGFRSYELVPFWVDMLLVDAHSRVHRYFQNGNPGGMVAEDGQEQKYLTLAEERALIMIKWTESKKLKAPPYQVLH